MTQALAKRNGVPSTCEPHAAAIVERYADGQSIRGIADALGLKKSAVGLWLVKRGEGGHLARARKAKAALLIDQAVAYLDDVDPESKFGSARVSKAREQANMRKYIAGCLDRQTWSESVKMDVSATLQVVAAFSDLSRTERDGTAELEEAPMPHVVVPDPVSPDPRA